MKKISQSIVLCDIFFDLFSIYPCPVITCFCEKNKFFLAREWKWLIHQNKISPFGRLSGQI